MVVGVDRFRDHFAGHDHQYVLIGGAACELLMGDVGLDFRATKDLDIVLIVEALDPPFSERFWTFVEEGAYQVRQRSDGKRVLYRFQKPKTPDFPAMLELFSRTPPGLVLADASQLTPLPIGEEAASLSAILLEEDYYEFLKSMVRTVDGIPVLDEAAIIPFKARAWIDLGERRARRSMNATSRSIATTLHACCSSSRLTRTTRCPTRSAREWRRSLPRSSPLRSSTPRNLRST